MSGTAFDCMEFDVMGYMLLLLLLSTTSAAFFGCTRCIGIRIGSIERWRGGIGGNCGRALIVIGDETVLLLI